MLRPYIEQSNLLYTITTLLGLHAGATILLRWICPLIVRLLSRVFEYRKERSSLVQPIAPQQIHVQSIERDVRLT
jgi:hypothetical protein